jgi:uncharacterized protein
VGQARQALVAEAVKRKLFRRGLGEDCRAPEGLPGQVADLLRRAALDYLSLANKAGLVIAGFEKVAAAIGKGRVAVLVEAADGAEDGRRKLVGKLNSSGSTGRNRAKFRFCRIGFGIGPATCDTCSADRERA